MMVYVKIAKYMLLGALLAAQGSIYPGAALQCSSDHVSTDSCQQLTTLQPDTRPAIQVTSEYHALPSSNLQELFNKVKNGGKISLARGVYDLGKTPIVLSDARGGFTIEGANKADVIIKFSGKGAAISIQNRSPLQVDDVTIENFTIDGIGTASSAALYIARSRGLLLHNLNSRHFATGIILDGSGNFSGENRIDHVSSRDCKDAALLLEGDGKGPEGGSVANTLVVGGDYHCESITAGDAIRIVHGGTISLSGVQLESGHSCIHIKNHSADIKSSMVDMESCSHGWNVESDTSRVSGELTNYYSVPDQYGLDRGIDSYHRDLTGRADELFLNPRGERWNTFGGGVIKVDGDGGGNPVLKLYRPTGTGPFYPLWLKTSREAFDILAGSPAALGEERVAPVFSVNYTGTVAAKSYHEELRTPPSSSASCEAGDFSDDADYHYVCTSTNKWKRAKLEEY
jgi:hypothetical protein